MNIRDIQTLSISQSATIQEAIQAINIGCSQIALVVSEDNRLLGTITDGDVRRGVLNNLTLNSPAERIMKQDFRFLSVAAPPEQALQIMRNEMLHQMPILDDKGRIVDLILLDELMQPSSFSNLVVLMAGGRGQRLRPLTDEKSKPMLLVNGKPMLHHILDGCAEAGFSRFYIAVNYLKTQIKDYFKDGRRWSVDIRYLEEDVPLGTAGALSLLPEKPIEPLIVMNADVMTRVNLGRLKEFHDSHESEATICLKRHYTEIPFGVIETQDYLVQAIREKPVLSHYINAGIYMLDSHILRHLKVGQRCDMPDLLQPLIEVGNQVAAFPIHESWNDVGVHETLNRINREGL